MRPFITTALTLMLMLQLGCASFKQMTVKRQQKVDSKSSEKFLAAKQLENQGRYERARELYDQLLTKNPKNPEYLHRMAVVCTQLQRYGEANSFYERARRLDPQNVSLLTDMGYTSYLRGKPVDAERILREALQLDRTNKRAVSNLALVVGIQGKTTESFALLRQVGEESSALAALAYIHTQRGESELAEQRYREALELDPNFNDATVALATLARQHRGQQPAELNAVANQFDSFDEVEELEASSKKSDIQLVSASSQSMDGALSTAGFFEESPAIEEPARLTHGFESDPPSETAGRITLSDDDSSDSDDADDDWETSAPATAGPANTVATHPTTASEVDEWSEEAPSTTQPQMQPKRLAPLPEPSKDDDFPTESQTETMKASTDSALTFGPRKRRPIRNVASQLMDMDADFAAPSVNTIRTE